MITLTPDQQRAGDLLLRHGKRIGGFAGTGKSVTIAHAVDKARKQGMRIILATPTNKAAAVLRRMTKSAAVMTLHSLTTTPSEVPELADDGVTIIGTKMVFSPKHVPVADHIVIDEGSMLGASFFDRIKHLFKSYSIVGDPFQLPPVKDSQLLTEDTCDLMLTEVMRQAEDNPALAYATELRRGGRRRAQDFGVEVTNGIFAKDLPAMGEKNAICITFTNEDRHWFNKEIRKIRTGRANWRPQIGDKVISRYTNPEGGVYNGLAGEVTAVLHEEHDRAQVTVRWESDETLVKTHMIDARRLSGREVPWDDRFGDHIEYGYAVTCHSAQGSSWDRVYIVPNIRVLLKHQGPQGMRRWLYTAVTRVAGDGAVTIVDNS